MRTRRKKTLEEEAAEEEEDEEDSGDVAVLFTNLHIETAGTEDLAAEGLAEALWMEGVEAEGSEG